VPIADITHPDLTCRAIDAEAPGIAESDGVDLRPRILADVGIRRGNPVRCQPLLCFSRSRIVSESASKRLPSEVRTNDETIDSQSRDK
jgi:hypothetical protein